MINIKTLDNFPLYSIIGLETRDVDREMYNHTMNLHPTLVFIDLAESIALLKSHSSQWAKELNVLIERHILNTHMNDDLPDMVIDVMDSTSVNVAINAKWNTQSISNADYNDISGRILKNYSIAAHTAIGKIINTFHQCDIPYFENVLPYRYYGVDPITNYAVFRQMKFDEFINHVISKQI